MASQNHSEEFYDDWQDPLARERAKLHNREVFEESKKQRDNYLGYGVQYGKWVLSSLLLLHGGAFIAISQIQGGLEIYFPIIGQYHIAGIIFALLSGFFAYLNFMFLAKWAQRYTSPVMLYRQDGWPKNEDKYDPVNATAWASLSVGLLSALMIIFSAVDLLKHLNKPAFQY